MKSNTSWKIWLAQILLGVGFILALVVVRGTHAGNDPIHLTTDWSHRRVVFSAPHNLGQHVQLLSNPRYVQQLVRKNSSNVGHGVPDAWRWRRAPEPTTAPPNPIHGDWSVYLGSGGTVGNGSFPAKYSFDVNSASCDTNNSTPNTNNNEDFVVYNTGLVPSAAGTDASITGTVSTLTGTNGTTVTITNNNLPAPNVLTLYANTGALATATGTITVGTRPTTGNTVTVGAVTYTFEQVAITAGTTQVLTGATNNTAAQNLRAALDDNLTECSTANCFSNVAGGITVANPVITHPVTYNGTTLDSLTAASDGAAGNFTVTDNTGNVTTAGGTNGQGANDGLNFDIEVSNLMTAQNLAAAITRNGGNVSPGIGVTAPVPATTTFTMSSTNTGLGGHPGNVDITVTSAVTGVAWTGGNGSHLAGGSAGASIVAYSNICPGGTGVVPWVYWSYNTGGQAVTSPVLSGDGKQVAFIQNVGTTGQLVLLKWAQWDGMTPPTPPTVDAPITLTTQATAAAYTTCTAPCMYTMPFTTATTDTNSDPFYDYNSDTIYVGDDTGHLRKFTGVFKGSPLQVSGSFPVTLTHAGILTSPVFDDATGKVFVASNSGYLSAVLATTGAQTTSSQVGFTNGINDSPILDTTNDNVYVMVSDDATGVPGNTGIFRFAAGFTGGTGGTETQISGSNPGTAIYDGDFDNAFYGGAAGHLYVCGPAAASSISTLYQIAISATGTLSTVVAGPALSTSANLNCSGVTEFFNPNIGAGTDLIFLSVTGSAVTTTPIFCPSATGCLMSFDVTSSAGFGTTKAPLAKIAVAGGASGVIVDNDASTATVGAGSGSQVYFTPLSAGYCTTASTSNSGLGIGGCAIQASQSALN